MFVLFDWLLDT